MRFAPGVVRMAVCAGLLSCGGQEEPEPTSVCDYADWRCSNEPDGPTPQFCTIDGQWDSWAPCAETERCVICGAAQSCSDHSTGEAFCVPDGSTPDTCAALDDGGSDCDDYCETNLPAGLWTYCVTGGCVEACCVEPFTLNNCLIHCDQADCPCAESCWNCLNACDVTDLDCIYACG